MRTKGTGLVQAEATPGPVLVANGEHMARLVDVFPFANAHGERLGFAYEIEGGPDAGAVVMQSANRSTSPTSKLADILRVLLRRDPTDDDLQAKQLAGPVGFPVRITTREERNRAGRTYSAVVSVAR